MQTICSFMHTVHRRLCRLPHKQTKLKKHMCTQKANYIHICTKCLFLFFFVEALLKHHAHVASSPLSHEASAPLSHEASAPLSHEASAPLSRDIGSALIYCVTIAYPEDHKNTIAHYVLQALSGKLHTTTLDAHDIVPSGALSFEENSVLGACSGRQGDMSVVYPESREHVFG